MIFGRMAFNFLKSRKTPEIKNTFYAMQYVHTQKSRTEHAEKTTLHIVWNTNNTDNQSQKKTTIDCLIVIWHF